MRIIKFGIIGCGLMGREFASAAARWCHLLDLDFKPEIIALCDTNKKIFDWYKNALSGPIKCVTDYKEILAMDDVEAIYAAVPHSLHENLYCDIINAGKHLMGEKPFGIDQKANAAINQAIKNNPKVFVRSSSEFPFYPGAQRVIKAIQEEDFGTILEVNAGFLHSSDMDPHKTLNWKRLIEINGEYGCMGDLGMHVFHIPLRLGWKPKQVYANLLNIFPERPDGNGKMQPCKTWDNAQLHCTVEGPHGNFPMTCKTYRVGPGETDTWYIEVKGNKKCVSFSTKFPKSYYSMDYLPGKPQELKMEDLGYTPVYPCITGNIFEFGFSDAILQMWAAFLDEYVNGSTKGFSCATPEEASQSHEIFTAALLSQKEKRAVNLKENPAEQKKPSPLTV
jgi:predicted dehydrogenase